MVRKRSVPRIIAHRGSADPRIQAFEGFSENTIKAFEWGLINGADGFECDIGGITIDGHLVMCHDKVIDGRRIGEMELADVGKIMININTFADVASWLRDQDAKCLLELKYYGFNCYTYAMVRKTIEIIEQYNISDKIQIISFDLDTLVEFWDFGWKKLGFLYENMETENALKCIGDTHSWLVLPREDCVNKKTVELFREFGFKVGTWTVDTPDRFKELIDLGLDYIITNRPDILVPLLPET